MHPNTEAAPASSQLNLALPIKRLGRFPARRVENDGVVVATHRGEAILLNGLGFKLWEWIDDQRNGEALLSLVMSHYEVSREQALNDLSRYLQHLSDLGLIGWNR